MSSTILQGTSEVTALQRVNQTLQYSLVFTIPLSPERPTGLGLRGGRCTNCAIPRHTQLKLAPCALAAAWQEVLRLKASVHAGVDTLRIYSQAARSNSGPIPETEASYSIWLPHLGWGISPVWLQLSWDMCSSNSFQTSWCLAKQSPSLVCLIKYEWNNHTQQEATSYF